MNILFISLMDCTSLSQRGIYQDLLRELRSQGHSVHLVSPVEKRNSKEKTGCTVVRDGDTRIVKPVIGNIKKTKTIEKGISTVMLSSTLRRAIKAHLSDVKFDLVLYPTPPITFIGAVEYVKRRDNATTYLMLKDIFPQNAVDIGMMSSRGPKGILLRHFRKQEKRLYDASDFIGCMSPANISYLITHNPSVDKSKVGLCPNSVNPVDMSCSDETKSRLRTKYGIPQKKKVFVYGGNLGRPQGVPFLIDCLRSQKNNGDVYFLIVGNGTEYIQWENYFDSERPTNAKLMSRLPKDDYDALVGSCDVGMIFLDNRFTIPNYPSRLLSYMQAKVPVLCATDACTDVGRIAEEGGYGVTCSSASVESFDRAVKQLVTCDLTEMGEAGWNYLLSHYDVRDVSQSIIDVVNGLRSAE